MVNRFAGCEVKAYFLKYQQQSAIPIKRNGPRAKMLNRGPISVMLRRVDPGGHNLFEFALLLLLALGLEFVAAHIFVTGG